MANITVFQRSATTVSKFIQANAAALKAALPAQLPPDRFARIMVQAVSQSEALARCNAGSLIRSALVAGMLGLEVNTPQQHAFLIAYADQATLQIGWRGLVATLTWPSMESSK